MIIKQIQLCLGISLAVYIVSAADCNKPLKPDFKHGRRVSCELTEDGKYEKSFLECDYGYEFRVNVTKLTALSLDGKRLPGTGINCHAIGCNMKDMPRKEKLETDPAFNILHVRTVCEPSILDDHCAPEKSYVEFACKDGFKLDTASGVNISTTPATATAIENNVIIENTVIPAFTNSSITETLFTITTPTTTLRRNHTPFHAANIVILGNYTFPTDGSPCNNKFRLPANYNESRMEFHLKREHLNDPSKHMYKPGSYMIFHCKNGFAPHDGLEMVSHCQADGQWSHVSDCELPKQNGSLPNYKPCASNFIMPTNHNVSLVNFEMEKDPSDGNYYKPGSAIKYKCKEGTYVYSNRSLTSTCQPDGTWSTPADCEPHPCWLKLPRRPLNGFREIGLVLNAMTGNTNGSHANFSCNTMFELVGHDLTRCSSGSWDERVPECRLMANICRVKPPLRVNNTVLKTLSRVEFKYELDYKRFEMHTAYQVAAYVCDNNMSFRNSTNVLFKTFNDVRIAYKNVRCVGPGLWEEVPDCK